MPKNIRVMILDDSAVMRELLRGQLSARGIEVVAAAPDPIVAWERLRTLRPDVLTLDVEMPHMSGLMFLEKIMREAPLPVVMVSSFTEVGCSTTLRALELGAVDFVAKPATDLHDRFSDWTDSLVEKLRQAANARPRGSRQDGSLPPPRRGKRCVAPGVKRPSARIVAIGASTGGPEAIQEILQVLPEDCPAILVVQHMPPKFTRAFASRLNGLCAVTVKEAADGDAVARGQVLVAPGDFHMRLARSENDYRIRLSQDAPVNRHRPSVDVLFESCAGLVGNRAAGILLTGMGEDGARGLRLLRQAGARTIAQDEATSVIYGMPRAARELEAADTVLPLERMADAIMMFAARAHPLGAAEPC